MTDLINDSLLMKEKKIRDAEKQQLAGFKPTTSGSRGRGRVISRYGISDTSSLTDLQLNIVNEKIYEVLGDIYKEMFQIFDPDVFHFGGDEVSVFF